MLSRPWNASRFVRGDPRGFYESYFQRGNHPTRPLAFWIRYTVFAPAGRPDQARGELWAIYFDGESNHIAAVKENVAIGDTSFDPAGLNVRIGNAALTNGVLSGRAASAGHTITWQLRFAGGQPPLLLLPEAWYARGLPKAKALVGTPNAAYDGQLIVDGQPVAVDGWQGSQNHNWGTKHTDRYAWGQVAGFDNAPDAFLECSTAQLKVGPFWTPRLTLLVLRVDGREYRLNSPATALRATGEYAPFSWTLETQNDEVRIAGRIHAPANAFVGLTYDNPPGGSKTCLNTKLAAAEITVHRTGAAPIALMTQHRAAFEILTDASGHGVPIVA
jgi:hypothetical protein